LIGNTNPAREPDRSPARSEVKPNEALPGSALFQRREETMSEQITDTTPLSTLAERATASVEWWKPGALERPNELELPTRVLVALSNADIHTVAQLRAAGPQRLRELEGIGKLGFSQIVEFLRALDRLNGGGSDGDHQQGQAGLR
jgi:DNA-directed RNA polymerase alpha subunit